MATNQQMHHPWVGFGISILIPGSGIFLAGDRRTGLIWFTCLTVLWLLLLLLGPLPAIPGILAFFGLGFLLMSLTLWMLFHSLKPIPRLGFRGWVFFAVLALGIAVGESRLAHSISRPFSLPTRSMEPTLQPGDHFLVQSSAYWFSPIKRGHLIAFRADLVTSPSSLHIAKGQIYLKRVIGLPGERLAIHQGYLLVNGRALVTTFGFVNGGLIPSDSFPGMTNQEYVVPTDSLFVIGDNHTNSLDSRYFGAVPRKSVIGRATKVYWPLRRAGDLQ
jgi:signal peptidase I